MNVSLLSIEIPSRPQDSGDVEPFDVRVRLNEAGVEHCYTLTVRPPPIPGLGAELIVLVPWHREKCLREFLSCFLEKVSCSF